MLLGWVRRLWLWIVMVVQTAWEGCAGGICRSRAGMENLEGRVRRWKAGMEVAPVVGTPRGVATTLWFGVEKGHWLASDYHGRDRESRLVRRRTGGAWIGLARNKEGQDGRARRTRRGGGRMPGDTEARFALSTAKVSRDCPPSVPAPQ